MRIILTILFLFSIAYGQQILPMINQPAPTALPDTTPPLPGGSCFDFSALTSSGPVTYNGVSNLTIQNLHFSGATSGNNITLINCTNITIQNCFLDVSKNHGISVQSCSGVTIQNNFFCYNKISVACQSSSGIKIKNNNFLGCHKDASLIPNITGGNFIQFNNVTGAGNEIKYNKIESIDGQSFPEDLVSIFESGGTSGSHLQIIGNRIKGASQSNSGVGIQIGDGGTANAQYVDADSNFVYHPGPAGAITLSGGQFETVRYNKIELFDWGGFYAAMYSANYGAGTCGNHIFLSDTVAHTTGTAYYQNTNPGKTCSPVTVTGIIEKATGYYTVPTIFLDICEPDYTILKAKWNTYN